MMIAAQRRLSRAVMCLALAMGGLSLASADRASAQETEDVSVRMDWVFSAYHAPFFVAAENGYYEEAGLEVSIEPGNGSATVAQAIGNGNGNFAIVDGGTMMNLASKGLQVKCVMGILQRSPLSVIYNTARGIKEPADLVGKSVTVTNGDAPSALLPAFMESTGLDPSQVNVISTDAAAKNATVISGASAAVVTFNFLAVPILEAAGIDVDTFDYAEYGVNVPGLCLIAHTDYIDENPEVVKRFVQATKKGYEWSLENPEKAIDILIAANPAQKIDRTLGVEVLKLSFDLLRTPNTANEPIGKMSPEDWANAENILAQYLDMEKAESPDRYFTNEFVEAE